MVVSSNERAGAEEGFHGTVHHFCIKIFFIVHLLSLQEINKISELL